MQCAQCGVEIDGPGWQVFERVEVPVSAYGKIMVVGPSQVYCSLQHAQQSIMDMRETPVARPDAPGRE